MSEDYIRPCKWCGMHFGEHAADCNFNMLPETHSPEIVIKTVRYDRRNRTVTTIRPENVPPERLSDVVDRLHIIDAPFGHCRCGKNGLTCGQMLAALSTDIRDAQIASALPGIRVGGAEPREETK